MNYWRVDHRQKYCDACSASEVARMLATGASVETICHNRRVERETIKSQLKSIYAKPGVSRRSKVVRMFNRLT